MDEEMIDPFSSTSKGWFRITLTCLLILCLSPAAVQAHWLSAWEESGAGSKIVLFSPASPNSTASVLAEGTRNGLDRLDNPLKAAKITWTPILLDRDSSLFLSGYQAGVSRLTHRAAILIRAPPRHHRCGS